MKLSVFSLFRLLASFNILKMMQVVTIPMNYLLRQYKKLTVKSRVSNKCNVVLLQFRTLAELSKKCLLLLHIVFLPKIILYILLFVASQ